jgi:hypothetical protein
MFGKGCRNPGAVYLFPKWKSCRNSSDVEKTQAMGAGLNAPSLENKIRQQRNRQMKTVRIALMACVAAMFMASLAAQAEQAKSGAAASSTKEMKAPVKAMKVEAKPVTITGVVKCEKDAKGVLTSVTIAGTKVAAKDEQKVAAFDGKKVVAIGTEMYGRLAVEKIEAAKEVEAAK